MAGKTSLTLIKDANVNQLANDVINASNAAIKAGKDLPTFEKAKILISFMAGDVQALKKLPTINTQKESLANDASLSEHTSESSLVESTGLLGLTEENITDIIRYVNKGLSFPTTESDAEIKLGYNANSEISKRFPDFSPASFVSFYSMFNTHAKLWADIEMGGNGIIAQGNSLTTYGKTFVSHADMVLEYVRKLDIFLEIKDIEVTETDKKKIISLGKLLERWQNETKTYHERSLALLDRLIAFEKELLNKLQPAADNKLQSLEKLDLAAETQKLKEEINELKIKIDALQKDYDLNVGLAFTGAAGMIFPLIGVITWSVTGGVFGAKAEKARKERNEVQKRHDDLTARYNDLNSVSNNVSDATAGIADLRIAITNAITGLHSLNAVWNLITQYLGDARDSLLSIDSKDDVLTFIFEMDSAKKSWSEIPAITQGLVDLFNKARNKAHVNQVLLLAEKEYDFFTKSANQVKIRQSNENRYGEFDLLIWKDRAAELNNALIKRDSKNMPSLHQKAFELREYARRMYDGFTHNLPVLIYSGSNRAQMASDYSKFEEYKEHPEAIERLMSRFTQETTAYDEKLAVFIKSILDDAKMLSDNTREDLTTIGYFKQLNDECKRFDIMLKKHSELIQNNFISPMEYLTEKIKGLDSDISKKIDPQNLINEFKIFLPSEEEVSGMIKEGSKSQEAAAIESMKLLYKTFLNSLDALGKVITLCKDVKKLLSLTEELSALREKYDKANADFDETLSNQRELNNLTCVFSPLKFFASSGTCIANLIEEERQLLKFYASKKDVKSYNETLTRFIDNLGAKF
ncbi:MAG: alpha-xenorhabdolysin family binary toxin subunit A [Oscillospiraceae bacterium]|nr:alpha-xenorhabdolysin family binary toxin subunit A [Oscillospiraceae bacterium]